MRVFRSQLPEQNQIYVLQESEDGAGSAEDEDTAADSNVSWSLAENVKPARQCAVCGLLGGKACSKCHHRVYCSRGHQVADWNAGHRVQCGQARSPAPEAAAHTRKLQLMLYPEHVISSEEDEDEGQQDAGNEDEESDDEGEDNEGIKPESMAIVPVTDERVEDSEVDVDRAFLLFQRRIQKNPDQVIRYTRSSDQNEPLFVSDTGKPEGRVDIPDCELCGAAREFEFQIMPQMLNFLSISSTDSASVDWGTLLVYTCPSNCSSAEPATTYAPEAICRQNFSSHGIGEKYVRAMHGDDS
ncbi:hypothetical protein EV174_006129, partial [Coemansia sp. RSA 2320]